MSLENPGSVRVETRYGPVVGKPSSGVNRFLGIPYAAPPTGERRWMPPQPPAAWGEARAADDFAPWCAQNRLGTFSPRSVSEDCLYLNVYTPSDRKVGGKLPVMVWIYGGGLGAGRANDYDPVRLVRDGNVVFVSLNYRVGPFGFFAHPAIDAEAHDIANYGLMDQQFALKWVQENIEKFGGDADNVTIFGESAGGASVFLHLASPASKGLFHKAIAQSGTMFGSRFQALFGGIPLKMAEGIGMKVAGKLACGNGVDAACLRKASTKSILEAYGSLGNGFFPGMAVADGRVLPRSVKEALRSGEFNRVPMINGGNRDEWTWMMGMQEYLSGRVLQTHELENALRIFFSDAAPDVARRYRPEAYGGSAGLARAHAETDAFFTCTLLFANRELARSVPVWGYYFEEENAPVPFPKVSFPYGVAHTLELQYLFEGFAGFEGIPVPLSGEHEELSRTMVAYWTAFARTGDPNSAADSATWPRLGQNDAYLSLRTSRVKPIPASAIDAAHQCSTFWNQLDINR